MLGRQPDGSLVPAGHDEAGDLDELPVTTTEGPSPFGGRGQMDVGGGGITALGGDRGEEGVGSGFHVLTMRGPAEAALTRR